MLRDAADLLIDASTDLLRTLVDLARTHRDTVTIGRTHGVHAEPTTFGAKVALWALQVDRDRSRLQAARRAVSVCKLSGAVGTYSNIDPAIERFVGERLGLTPVPATQVIARDRHAEYLWACAAVGSTMELIAVELRHLQRTEVREVMEGFKVGQKGSSAMPHKRNPISAETISGLSRVLRGNLQAGLQDVALWHERDISHSSVERVVLPDSSPASRCAPSRCATTSTRAMAWYSVKGCCSRWCRQVWSAIRRTASCRATRCEPGTKAETSVACSRAIRWLPRWVPVRLIGRSRSSVRSSTRNRPSMRSTTCCSDFFVLRQSRPTPSW
jgi:hypothetical protein